MPNKVTTNLGRVSIVPKGPYDAGATYDRLDVVSYNDNGYVAKHGNLKGVEPTDGDDWMMLVGSGSARLAEQYAEQAKGSAEAAKKSEDAAAASVKVLRDNEAAIQGIADNLETITDVHENMDAVTDVHTNMATVQGVNKNMTAVQNVNTNMAAVQGAADNALAAQSAAEDAATSAETAQEAADRAQSISQGALGYYALSSELTSAYPKGQNGQWAIIGETDTIWVWDSDASEWTDSGNKTDLSQYYTKDEADANLDELQTTLSKQITAATSHSWEIEVQASAWKAGTYTATFGSVSFACTQKAEITCAGMTADTALAPPEFVGGDLAAAQVWAVLIPGDGIVTIWSETKPAANFALRLTEVR